MNRDSTKERRVEIQKAPIPEGLLKTKTIPAQHIQMGSVVYQQNNVTRNSRFTGAAYTANTNFESLLGDINEYWEKRKKISFPTYTKHNQGCDFLSLLTLCITKVSSAAMVFSIVIFVQNSEAFGASHYILSIKRAFQGSSRYLAVRITAGVFIVSSILYFVCIAVCAVRKNKTHKARENLISKLYETAEIYYMYRPAIDSEMLSLHKQLRETCGSLLTRIGHLESDHLEYVSQLDVLAKMQSQHGEMLAELRRNISEDLIRIDKDIMSTADAAQHMIHSVEIRMHEHVKALEDRVMAYEGRIADTISEINRCSELNTDMIRSILREGLAYTTKKAGEVRGIMGQLRADISLILKENAHETEHVLERVVKARQECMKLLSYMFVDKNTASMAACATLLEAYSHIKEVSLLSNGRAYEAVKKKLEYRIPGKITTFFLYDTLTVNETISSVCAVLTKALTPIFEHAEEIKKAAAEGRNCPEYGEICMHIVRYCEKNLFCENGILKNKVFTAFLRKLSELVKEESTGSAKDALDKIKKCVPFFLVIHHILRIARGIEGMHVASDEICAILDNFESRFTGMFPFGPKVHYVTSQLDEPVVSDTAPIAALEHTTQ